MATVVACLADLRRGAKKRPRLPYVTVLLPEVNAVRTDALCKSHAVIDDERHVSIGADTLKRLRAPGKLVLVNRKARMGRNPATGEAIKIPAKRVVKFRVAKAAKDAILGAK